MSRLSKHAAPRGWAARLALSAAVVTLCGGTALASTADKPWADLGRTATPAEVAAWDIDVRPDFVGLPKGSGSVMDGEALWEAKCAACHGSFGESNEVFTPLVGGTTVEDIEKGRVKGLQIGGVPQRSSMMKVATVSTLWDYIYRAMPWDAPRSLSPDETYALTAYLLNLAEVVDADYELSNENIAEVQARMPNRNGMTTEHGMWRMDGTPDVKNTACMSNCMDKVVISSELPDHARNAHGDIAAQNRVVGPVRGVDTMSARLSGTPSEVAQAVRAHAWSTLAQAKPAAASADAPAASADDLEVARLVSSNTCVGCHAVDRKQIGPSYTDIAAKYKGQDGAVDLLVSKIRDGGSGNWGAIPMPPNPTVSEADIGRMVQWILKGAPSAP